MAGEKVDLAGIRFRPYQPTFEDDAEAEAYDPPGPGDADETPGGVDLSCIAFRAWEENELDNT